MKVGIGSDHRGIEQRKIVAAAVQSASQTAVDCGTDSTESFDYPDVAKPVAERIASGDLDRGILICGTGIGMSIAANKVNGIRAAVCHDAETARLSRQHNDANVLCISGHLSPEEMATMVTTWLSTDFEGGRHQRRVDKVMSMEC